MLGLEFWVRFRRPIYRGRVLVLQFVERIVSRDLRMADGDRRLEWQVGERWLQAVPFVPDTNENPRARDTPWSRSQN